jgi:hypothetical protein
MPGQKKSITLTEFGTTKRHTPRLPTAQQEPIRLTIGDQQFEGELLDESPGGMGIYVSENVFYPKGTAVRVVARRRCHFAVVVRCVASDGGSIIGIRASNNQLFWKPPPSSW